MSDLKEKQLLPSTAVSLLFGKMSSFYLFMMAPLNLPHWDWGHYDTVPYWKLLTPLTFQSFLISFPLMGENKRGRSTDAERQLFTYSKDTLQDGESSFPLTFFLECS